ncbi:MAG: Quinolone resistance protein norA [Microgenomates group bacterium GW2011_GWA2_46_7]|nr:MAG: Quinolone resistance protein norA [Microgenomates group bacterium GW2011_GWA2_46_7]
MRKMFPTFSLNNIKTYYWLGIFLNGWFILPNWVFFFRQHITQIQIGWVEGAAVLVGILMEVPSGALADLLGKKKTIIAGSLIIILACLVLINATSFTHFLIGNIMMFIGFSFQSGATEAFAYDSMKEKGTEQHYDVVAAKHTSLSIAATLFSTFVGGFLYSLAPEAPFYAWILFLSISIALLLYTTEPKIDTTRFSAKVYLTHLKEGVKTLFSHSLRNYLIPILMLPITIKLYQGLVRQSMAGYFGYTGETFGYLFALVSIPAIYLSFKYDLLRKFWSNKNILLFNLFSFMCAFFVASITQSLLWGGGVYLIINLTENIAKPLISSLINERIDSKHRATTLSTLSLVTQTPYIILVTFFAFMTEEVNLPSALL